MEMISGLCFGQSSAPEEKLVDMLLNTVFKRRDKKKGTTRPKTRDLTPYEEDLETHEVPVIKSFLLQLLLKHKCVMVKWEGGARGESKSESNVMTRVTTIERLL